MSMSTVWQDEVEEKRVTAPVSLIISAFALAVRISSFPLRRNLFKIRDSSLILIDLGRGKNRLGSSILGQVYGQMGMETPDVDSSEDLTNFWNAIQQLGKEGKILAYHGPL